MRGCWNRKKAALTAAALVLAGGMGIQGTLAYFTTYASATGSLPLSLGSTTTEIKETVGDRTKEIQIVNTGETDCYVRVRVFAGDLFTIKYVDETGPWSKGKGDWYYYNKVLPAGDTTETLKVIINVPDGYTEDFNVAVVQECTPVLYQEDGTPYADWNLAKASTGGEEAGK